MFSLRAPVDSDANLVEINRLMLFIQVSPTSGAAPTRHTELGMAHDSKALSTFGPEPAAVEAWQMRCDVEGMLSEDCIKLVFDPNGDG